MLRWTIHVHAQTAYKTFWQWSPTLVINVTYWYKVQSWWCSFDIFSLLCSIRQFTPSSISCAWRMVSLLPILLTCMIVCLVCGWAWTALLHYTVPVLLDLLHYHNLLPSTNYIANVPVDAFQVSISLLVYIHPQCNHGDSIHECYNQWSFHRWRGVWGASQGLPPRWWVCMGCDQQSSPIYWYNYTYDMCVYVCAYVNTYRSVHVHVIVHYDISHIQP